MLILPHENEAVNFSDERFNPDDPPDTARVELVILALVMLDGDAAKIAKAQLKDDDMYYGSAMAALRHVCAQDNTLARCALSKLYGSADGAQKFIDAVNLEMVEQNASPDRIAEYCEIINADIRRSRSIAPTFPDEPDTAMDTSESILAENSETALPIALTIDDLLNYNTVDDPNALFSNRWICRGGSFLLIGSTGAGKSSLATQAAVTWALGESLFGIKPVRPLRSLIVQAENDVGDLSEMTRGVINGLGYSTRANEVQPMLRFISDAAQSGDAFIEWIERLIDRYRPDIVWIDPLFSFFGANVSDQAAVSKFLRNGLGAIAQRTGVVWAICHHTNKPIRDAPKGGGLSSDLTYLGSGHAEFANWARSVLTLRETEAGLFELQACKRGKRAGLIDHEGKSATAIFLAHGQTGICWERADPPALSGTDATKKAEIFEVLERMKTHPADGLGWRYSAVVALIVEIRGGKTAGAKAWLQRTLSPYLSCVSGIYAVRGCKVAHGCK